MNLKNWKTAFAILITISVLSCNSEPRVIESESAGEQAGASMAAGEAGEPLVSDAAPQEHKVLVAEVLNTDRYTYLNVSENDKKFWVAIPRSDIEVGEVCYFRGGLMKKNFFSPEFNRVFETLYLVSEFWKQPSGGSALDEAYSNLRGGEGAPGTDVGNINRAEGAVKLSELFANKDKYSNRTVKVTGKCVKVNPRIMDRNWVHLRDGSGEGIDLTVTTLEDIPLGSVVTLEGTIALDKDFGAGYRYDVIMEGAVLQ